MSDTADTARSGDTTGTAPAAKLPWPRLVRLGLLLTLAVMALGSLRFARYDWSGIPLDRAPLSATTQVTPDCLERTGTYTLESGRVVNRTVVDEQQYMSLVELFRGVPRSEVQWTCLYDPFSYRSGTPWLAHLLPWDEAISLSVVNSLLLLGAVWFMLVTLRELRYSERVIRWAGLLFAVSWNTIMFGTGLLVDTSVLFFATLLWFLIVQRRYLLVGPVIVIAYPFKEAIGVLLVVLFAALWREVRERRMTWVAAALPAALGALCAVASVFVWRQALPQPDAVWDVSPDLKDMAHNLFDPVSNASFALGVLPVAWLGLKWAWRRRRAGLAALVGDPAVVGLGLAIAVCGWAFLTANLSPRQFWIGYPFAATLTAAALAGCWRERGASATGGDLDPGTLEPVSERVAARA